MTNIIACKITRNNAPSGFEWKGDLTAEFVFADASELHVKPRIKWHYIEGLRSGLLYQAGVLEALAVGWTGREGSFEPAYWSRGKISQRELAEYLRAAYDLGEEFSHDHDRTENPGFRYEQVRVADDVEAYELRKIPDTPKRLIDRRTWEEDGYSLVWLITKEISSELGPIINQKKLDHKPGEFEDVLSETGRNIIYSLNL